RLTKPLIGDDGRIYSCFENTLFAFESNWFAWSSHLNYACNVGMAPVQDGKGKIYLVPENRILIIKFQDIGFSGPVAEVFFGPGPGQQEPEEIIGLATSTMSSSVFFFNIRNPGLFAYLMRGQLVWSLGPVLYQFGYCQGCRKTVTDCYFSSAPVIDRYLCCIVEIMDLNNIFALHISNNQGEIYSLSMHSPHFKWIQGFSSLDKILILTPGNNGRLYVTVPTMALLLALDVSLGNVPREVLGQPLLTADCAPVFDANGNYIWISIGSLDGFLYSFSQTGILKNFPKAVPLDSVIQVSPLLDCSGYGFYISQIEMEGKISRTISEYTYMSSMNPISVAFTLLVPATGSIYLSESYPGNKFSLLWSESDLKHFVLDEEMLLAFVTAASEFLSTKTTYYFNELNQSFCNERTIVLFLLFESVILIVLAGLVRFCCIFWGKNNLQGQDLGNFLEKRRSLQLKKKAFDRTITELEQKAAEEAVANGFIEKLGDLVRERQGIERKQSTTYNLWRDRAGLGSWSISLLPLFDGKSKSYSFQSANKESVTIFHTLSGTSRESSNERDISSNSEEEMVAAKGKAKAPIEAGSSSDDGIKDYRRSPSEPSSSSRVFINPLFEEQYPGEEKLHNEGQSSDRSIWLKRRALSSTN
ncbi:LOW QUALITY PROTEIN: hypothetical protein CFOL_v3_23953, partial [Cephalotus follicularis]